jgi:hypothetical protein
MKMNCSLSLSLSLSRFEDKSEDITRPFYLIFTFFQEHCHPRSKQAVIDCHEVDRNGEKGLEKPGVEGWLN